MIALVRGILISKHPGEAILEAAGVGYRVFVPLSTFEKLPPAGSETILYTSLIVRDDALHLYGFQTLEEKDCFLMLTSVSGVGPKLGLNILSGAKVKDLRTAIESEDITFLSRLPGLGKKTATKIVFELKGKLPAASLEAPSGTSGLFDDALSALINLGYRKADAEAALNRVMPSDSLEVAITASLKLLSKARL